MIAVADFLIKVIICSGLLTGFYWIALRNKLFHQWNRYYLIAVVAVSLCIPFIKITLTQTATTSPVTYQALQTVTTNEAWIEDSQIAQENGKTFFTSENIVLLLYALISLLVLLMTIAALLKIGRLLKANQKWKIDSLTFVETDAKGTPFSFFRFLFWNNAIDFHSEKGQQIFAHELIHVEEKHSADKLLMQLVLIVFWINPFFWLIRKELTMIHEFIADQKSVKNHDTASFAAMILASVYPTVNFPMTNSFFYSPIKRRLLMLSKLQNPKVSYFSRLLLLPLLTLIFFAFVLKTKTVTKQEAISNLDKQIIVVIDAGHGFKNGSPDGAHIFNGLSEDEISLAISKKIGELNTDKNLKLIFTRTGKDFVGLHERGDFAIANKADLFVSIHANFAPQLREGNKYVENPDNGFESYVVRDGLPFVAESKRLAAMIVNEMQGIITVKEPAIRQRQQGIWVLQSTNCPAVLLECGFISNKKDAEFLSDEKNQEKMAEAILRGIKKYVSGEKFTIQENVTVAKKDTTPEKSEPIFTETEIAPKFKGNWMSYVHSYLDKYYEQLVKDEKSRNNGCLTEFLVKKDGTITDIKILTNTESELAKIIPDLLKNSSKWEPAVQNGITVTKLHRTTINFFDKEAWKRFEERHSGENTEETGMAKLTNRYGYFLIDGVVVSKEEMKELLNKRKGKNDHWKFSFLDGQSGIYKYGDKGKNGVMEVTTQDLKPVVAVAVENMNTMIAGKENLLRIAVSDVPQASINVKVSQGKIEKRNDKFVIKDLEPGELVVTVSYYYNSSEEKTEQLKYNVVLQNK